MTAVQPLDARTLKWVEYVDESALGTFPTNPTMTAFPGLVTNFNFTSGPELDKYSYFKSATDTDPLSSGTATKSGETHTWSVELKMSALGLLPHALMATNTTTYAPGVTHLPFSIGAKIGADFTTFTGCIITSWVVDIPDMTSAATLTIEGMAFNRTDFSTTYVGTGAHATAPTDAVLTMGSVANVQYDNASTETADLYMGSLRFGVQNNVTPVLDVGSSLASKYTNYSLGPREFVLEVDSVLLGTAAIDDAKDGAAHEFEFDFGGKTFTFTNVIWDNSPSVDCNPEDLIGFSLSAEPTSARLAITTA